MRQIILISNIFFIFVATFQLNGQNIWQEEFKIPEKGVWATESGTILSDLEGVDWWVDVTGCSFVNSGDYAKTVTTGGGRFEVLDSDGDAIWYSPELDISKFSNISVKLFASETGSSTAADKKFVRASYILDGNLFPFNIANEASGNWGEKDLSTEGINGSKLQLAVTMNSSYANDKVFIDNILVEGVDSSLFEPSKIVVVSSPSTVFVHEKWFISAYIENRRGEKITAKMYDIRLVADEMNIIDFAVEEGTYRWELENNSTGSFPWNLSMDTDGINDIEGVVTVYSQENLVLIENFENNFSPNWESNGQWELSSDSPISGNSSLKHIVQPAGGLSEFENKSLDIELGSAYYQFSFKMKNGNWDPSSSNRFYFYMLGGIENQNGYAVGVNALGSTDLVSIWKVKDGNPLSVVAETSFDWNENGIAQIDISRTSDGLWALTVSSLTSSLVLSAIADDQDYQHITSLGFAFQYSQTRSGQLWIDDLMVFRENVSPAIKHVVGLPGGIVQVTFTEKIATTNLTLQHFSLQGKQTNNNYPISSFRIIDNQTIELLTEGVDENQLILTCLQIEDLEGAISGVMNYTFSYQIPVQPFDVVINEIMADPTPAMALPEAEFVELYNRTAKAIDITGWKIVIGSSSVTFPDFSINPAEYLIVCSQADSLSFSEFGRVLAVGKLPSLLNAGAEVRLVGREEMLIDRIQYEDSWYNDTKKDDGGWTLERIDPDRNCGQRENWTSAIDPRGGTPGAINSVFSNNTDVLSPTIQNVTVLSGNSLQLLLSERLADELTSPGDVWLKDSDILTDSIIYSADKKLVTCYFNKNFDRNKIYTLVIRELADDCGNVSSNLEANFELQRILQGEIVINEVLFNPFTGGSDFVEIVNLSGRDLDIKSMKLATRDDSQNLKSLSTISDQSLIIPTLSYLAFTKSPDDLVLRYHVPYPERIIAMGSFPSYPDDKGWVVLLNDSSEVIDELYYHKDMHSNWVSDPNGVSLERLSVTAPANDRDNWYSASSSAGYATPGYENSQKESELSVHASVSISPDAISPNNDGYNDEMEILLKLDKTGYVSNIFVFDMNGRIVSRVANNQLTGTEERIVFKGETSNGVKLGMGIYILVVELVNTDGKRDIFKKSFLVTDRK
jgi:hypothetical protein